MLLKVLDLFSGQLKLPFYVKFTIKMWDSHINRNVSRNLAITWDLASRWSHSKGNGALTSAFLSIFTLFHCEGIFFTSLLTRRNSEKCRSSSGIGDASYAWTAEAAQSKPYLKCRPGCALYLNLLPKLLTQHIFQMGVLQLYYFSAAPLSLPHMLNIEEICLISAISFFSNLSL